MKKAKCISFLGTGSDVGKSIVVTAVCRIFKNMGYSVAPYKAQNMSNNSYVTLEGGEIGRAQVAQAEAAGLEPLVDMNPVLLKPNTDLGSQVVLQGQVIGNRDASDYFKNTTDLFEKSKESLNRLRNNRDLIVIEGAGSCAEVNLRSRDFVNFETAHACDAPVILIADINRGGVFAQIIGSLAVMPPEDKKRVAGIIINKFRGDMALFTDGVEYIEKETHLPVLGVIEYFRHIEIDSEDGMPLETIIDPINRPDPQKIKIAAIRFPHISNFTDFDPLIRDEAVDFHYLSKTRNLMDYDVLILPGTKNVRFDLKWLKDNGWEGIIKKFADAGKRIIGICGGYQMLGEIIKDPDGIEGKPGFETGFSLLGISTILKPQKVLSRTYAQVCETEETAQGYEIHMGETKLSKKDKPFLKVNRRNEIAIRNEYDGAINQDGKIWGSYLHGIFDHPIFREYFLQQIQSEYQGKSSQQISDFKNEQYNLLAKHFEKCLDIEKLKKIALG